MITMQEGAEEYFKTLEIARVAMRRAATILDQINMQEAKRDLTAEIKLSIATLERSMELRA